MTKAELRIEVKRLVGGVRTGTSLTDAWYDTRILNAFKYLVTFQGQVLGPSARKPKMRILRFPTMEDRKTQTLDETMTSNFQANQSGVLVVLDLYDRTNNRPIDWANESDVRSRDPDEPGRVQFWRSGAAVGVRGYHVWPFPDIAADAIDVYEQVVLDPTLASDSTEPTIPSEWHMAIAYAAGSEASRLLDMSERAQELEGEFMNMVATRVSPGERASLGGRGGTRRNIRVGGW